jgi:plastocyanin
MVLAVAAPVLAATRTVRLTAENVYTPANLTVEVNDRVDFVWEGGFHDVVFADGASSGAPTGDPNTSWSRRFNTVGSFGYICTVHEALGMTGTVTVVAAGDGNLPFTGPEDTVLPLLGLSLMAAGIVLFVRTSRRRRV